ncbi:MAG: hypothetical protein IT392_11795 [Nitrospirae bacterium]|nr:hypothetical protein [Nitrospirota bacterium]
MGEGIKPFEFRQCTGIIKSTGMKARNLLELRDMIAKISDDSLFHHTCQYFLKGHILEYTNDFAQWAGESLEERALAEHLSNVDSYEFGEIDDLRLELLRVINGYVSVFPEPREAISGNEFYFNEAVTFIFSAGVRARNLAEFLIALKYIDSSSIYYHFYEARVRLGDGTDDFSRWVEEALRKRELAERIRAIDLFIYSLEGIRERIIKVIEEELRDEMEFRGGE